MAQRALMSSSSEPSSSLPPARTKLVHITTVPLSLRFFRGQIAYLQARGYDVEVISSPGPLLDETRDVEHVKAHAIRMCRQISLFSDLVSLWRLSRTLVRVRPDIVHSHTPKAALLGSLASRVARVPNTVVSIFGLPQMTRGGLTRHILDATTRLTCRLADLVWCDSFSVRDFLCHNKLCPSDKVVVLGSGSVNGVDAERSFSPDIYDAAVRETVRHQYNIPREALVLGFVGRIVTDKGMHDLAEAWREVRERHPTLHLLLVGPLEPEAPLPTADATMFTEDDRIHLVGLQSNVAPFLAAMDIFVLPSHREGFGVTNIEAAAMSLPVVATSIPGCTDSVQHASTGTLVPPRDPRALASAISAYCDDDQLRVRHGAAGRRRIRREFRQEVIWAELDALYKGLTRVHE